MSYSAELETGTLAVTEDVPKFLVEWSSPWEEFKTALRPALSRSKDRLAGEAQTGLFPYRGMIVCWLMEAVLLAAVIVIPAKLASLTPALPPAQPKYDVIYFSGDELPRTEDAGGAQMGKSGRSGGKEAFHRTQTIRVARGSSPREKVVDAPNLKLPVSNAPVANLLAYKPVPGPPPSEGLQASLRNPQTLQTTVVAPPPSVSQNNMRQLPALNTTVVAPAPSLPPDKMRQTPSLSTSVVAPSPSAPQRDLTQMQVPGSRIAQVVPPPVSAPQQTSSFQSRLSLPAQQVVAPPPSQIPANLSLSGPGLGPGDPHKQVVPPPVQLSGAGSGSERQMAALTGSATVVPPPVQFNGGASSRGNGGGLSGNVSVVAPPPSLSTSGSLTGRGTGFHGAGLGGVSDSGDVAAPPKGGGSGKGNGVVVSSNPGTEKGLPSGGGAGALAMSPKGGKEPGLGGAGGGTSIGKGTSSGSGFEGTGTGAGKDGSGLGSDPNSRGGISPYPGPGGAGKGVSGKPSMPGVSVNGGSNNVINLPSFGETGDPPSDPARSSKPGRHGPDITIVATSRSGGAFNFYGYLKGDKVYTIYIDTAIGPAVMQYADPSSASRSFSQELGAPEPLRADLPGGLLRSRLVIACVLDRSGTLKSFQVLEPGSAVMTAKVLAALPKWKFSPAMRGEQPVEVNAILGFNIDTSDRR
ncbi:MAG TPA: hypothetical protein VGF06_05810 [Terriglobales bacterium]|jgi:hypothetical protein